MLAPDSLRKSTRGRIQLHRPLVYLIYLIYQVTTWGRYKHTEFSQFIKINLIFLSFRDHDEAVAQLNSMSEMNRFGSRESIQAPTTSSR